MTPAAHRHLDDEALNAVLDGEATAEEVGAAAGCAECSARLDRFRQVASAVAAPAPPSETGRRRAVEAALRAGTPALAPAPPLAARRRWRTVPAWAAAAAVVAAGALALPLVDDRGEGTSRQEQASTGDPGDQLSAGSSLADQRAMPPDLRDLGEVDLARLDELARSVAGRSAALAPFDLAAPDAAPGAPGAAAGAPEATAEAGDTAPGRAGACEEVARRRDPALGSSTYAAVARVEGRPVFVLAFEVPSPGAPPATRLVVLAADGCAELASTSVPG